MRSSRPTKGLEAVEGEEEGEEDVVEEARLEVEWSEDAPGPAVVVPRPREEPGPGPGAAQEAAVVEAEVAAEEERVAAGLK